MQNVQTLRPASYSHDEQRPHAKFQPPSFKTVDLYREECTLEKYIVRRQNETFLLIFKDCEKAAQGNGPP